MSVQGLITLWLRGFVNPDDGVGTLPVGSPPEAELCAAWTRHPRPAHGALEPLHCFLFLLPSPCIISAISGSVSHGALCLIGAC